jgi:guanyl-specific ribonuclease Sa
MSRPAPLIALLALMIATVVGGCTGDSSETTTTTMASTTSSTTTTIVEDTTTTMDTTLPASEMTVEEMCHTLALLFYSGTYPTHAADGIRVVEFEDMLPSEQASYASFLYLAPSVECPEYTDYALDIAYGLGY